VLRVSWAVVESMRTWIVEQNFQIPPLYVDVDELTERRRRAEVPKRVGRRSRVTETIVPRKPRAA